MAITINGTANTVAGLAVGGLPDGSTDADALASNAVTNVKVADDAIGVAELSATGTAGNTTYLRGDNAWVVPPDTQGKILGYARQWTSSATDCSALTGFTEIGSFALSYTPTAATSKLLFIAQLNLTVRAVNSSYYGHMEVQFKHGSIATSEHWDLYRGTGSGTGTAHSFPYTFVCEFDATNTTARDTTVEIHNASAIAGGANNGHLYFNEYSGRSSMQIFEVAA